MFKNYLKIALRNLIKHKVHSLINISGLAIGMACCILILLWVQDELSYDKFHKNAKQIYRTVTEFSMNKEKATRMDLSPAPMAPTAIRDFPEVISAARFMPTFEKTLIHYKDKHFYEENLFFTDASVFDVFTFPFIKGSQETALKEPYSVLITEETAQKYFGEEYPIGKILTIDYDYVKEKDFKITGILEDIPQNSHVKFDFLVPFANLQDWYANRWVGTMCYSYLLLPTDYPPVELEKKFPDFVEKYIGVKAKEFNIDLDLKLHLQPLTRIHLYSNLDQVLVPVGDITYVYLFSAIAFFILLIGCINFINLTTARAANRAKEVGMRKVAGAPRMQLIKQFLGESLFLSFIALLVASALVEFILPTFNTFVGKELRISHFDYVLILFGSVGIVLFAGFLAGSYPAFFLSAFQPIAVLKGITKTGSKSSLFRKILVVGQFAISIVLIIGTAVILTQMRYIRNKKMGFNKEHVVAIGLENYKLFQQIYPSFKNEILQNSNIKIVSAISHLPPSETGGADGGEIRWKGPLGKQKLFIPFSSVDFDCIETLGMEIIEGRSFLKEFPSDVNGAFILNEAAVKKIGMESPIGKELGWFWSSKVRKGTIVGVVKDFHFTSLRQQIQPYAFINRPVGCRYILIRINPENISSTLAFLKGKWKKFAPNRPFEYSFLDEGFDNLYRSEEKLGHIFSCFSSVAIFIACLGLFGLASFTAEQRTKEIGIRKVLGASISGIVMLLTKEFTKWVLFANIIAWPIAYYTMNKWLQNFAYRINIGIWTFLLAGALALVIALLTVSYQAIKAATANPVEALRYE